MAMNDGNTPIHRAANMGHIDVVMLLMANGAVLNTKNAYGDLPYDVAQTEEIRQAITEELARR